MDIQGDYTLGVSYGSSQQILNAGTFRKSAGTNSAVVSGIAFVNTGTVEAQSGTLSFGATLTNAGGGFAVRLNGAADWGRFTFASALTLNGPFSVSVFPGYTPAWGSKFQVMAFPAASGQLTAFYGLNLGGGVQLVPTLTSTVLYLEISPQLSVSHLGNDFLVSWPSVYTNYQLFSTTNLAQPVWQSVTPTGPNQFLKTPDRPQEYFRLAR
jgi:hypothetical protein